MFDEHLVAGTDRRVDLPDELRKDVLAVPDERFAVVADDDPVGRGVQRRLQAPAAGRPERELPSVP